MNSDEPDDAEVYEMLREIHRKVTMPDEQSLYVSISFPDPADDHDERPREIQIHRNKLPRVGEYIYWNDHPYNRSRVVEVRHGFPSHFSRHAHTVTLVVEDLPGDP